MAEDFKIISMNETLVWTAYTVGFHGFINNILSQKANFHINMSEWSFQRMFNIRCCDIPKVYLGRPTTVTIQHVMLSPKTAVV